MIASPEVFIPDNSSLIAYGIIPLVHFSLLERAPVYTKIIFILGLNVFVELKT